MMMDEMIICVVFVKRISLGDKPHHSEDRLVPSAILVETNCAKDEQPSYPVTD